MTTQEFLKQVYEEHKANDSHHCERWVEESGDWRIVHDPYTFELFSTSALAKSFVTVFERSRT